nr:reverse transcriptase domain-containing protein [Tanacetum cinerariifolium]
MSSDNAQSAVTYTSISSDSDGPSWVEDNVEDPEKDLSEEHEPVDNDEDLEEDPNEEHKLEDEDTKEPSESSNKTEPFEEDETRVLLLLLEHLEASEQRMMTSIKEVNLRVGYQAKFHRQESKYFYAQLHDAQTDRKDIRLEIDSAEDLAVTQMMRIYALEARAQTDTVEDANKSIQAMIDRSIQRNSTHTQDDASQSSGEGLRRPVQPACGTLKKKLTDKYCPKGKIKKLEIKLWNLRVKGNDVAANTQRFQELALMSILGTYLCEPSAITIILYNAHPSVENARGMVIQLRIAGTILTTTTEYIKKNSPKLKNRGNVSRNDVAQGRAYALGGRDASPDSNVITGTFLLNNRYAKIFFDTGADRSFVSTTFNALIYITTTTLENHYDVELADGKIIRVNTIIRGCTLNFMNQPFNIDLMHVPLGSFDVIIGMDWLTKYHGVIIYDEKRVHVPFRREMLIFKGN